MGSNTSLGRARKGSKFWMQTIINSQMKDSLNAMLGDTSIEWLSPLREENYKEYKLNEPSIEKLFSSQKIDFSFWPNNQPQWDAIGKSENTIYLVEAKAHTKEVSSKLSATSKKSIAVITDALQQTFIALGGQGNFSAWTEKYYQFANRLAFNNYLTAAGFDVRLIFLNIIDDPTHIPTTQNEWNIASKDVYKEMFGHHDINKVPQRIKVIYFQV